MVMRGEDRHEARERSLAVLYEAEVRGVSVTEVLDALPKPPSAFAREMASGVWSERDALDERIATHLKHWDLARVALVDHVLLRMATWEIGASDTPTAVILSEAMALASEYSTEGSGKFINGVAGSISRELRESGDEAWHDKEDVF